MQYGFQILHRVCQQLAGDVGLLGADSNEFDNDCYLAAVKEVLGIPLDTNWEKYQHLTDWGILRQTLNELCVQEEQESM